MIAIDHPLVGSSIVLKFSTYDIYDMLNQCITLGAASIHVAYALCLHRVSKMVQPN